MEQSKDNIYIKLALIRSELQNMNLKKTGVNSYAKFKYFELVDFLPAINDLALKYHVVNVINFSNDEAYLSIIDADCPDQSIKFSIKMSYVNMKGANELQNLGASCTYLRRYLYMIAYEICESDIIDSSNPIDNEYKCSVCNKTIASNIYLKSIKKYGSPVCSEACKNHLSNLNI